MIGVDYGVLNQRGSPSWFSDIYANLPTAGYKGRMFISTDTFAFYRDTGTGWDLIGGLPGTITGSGTSGQVSYFNGSSTLAGSNNLFWDITNSRLGIGTATPGASLDIHSTGTNAQFNGTGTNNAYLVFQNAGTSKWRIGNTYNAGANSFDIYNNGLANTPLSINSASNLITLTGNLSTNSYISIQNGLGTNQIYLTKSSGDVYGTIQTEAGGNKFSLGNVSNIGTLGTPNITWTSGMQVGINNSSPTYDFDVTGTGRFTGILRLGSTLSNGTYFYTLPSATGTLALTSDLSSYLPLTGGTLTGALVINPSNTLTIGLDVASNTTRFRSDNLEGSKRQLEITMGSGTLVQLVAKGYGANYGTDLAFYTATTSGTNASPGIYITGTNNRVGIKTGTPAYDLDVAGTIRSQATLVIDHSSGSSINIKNSSTDDWNIGEFSGAADRNFRIYNFNTTTICLTIDRTTNICTIANLSATKISSATFDTATGGQFVISNNGTSDWIVGENAGAATRDLNIYNYNTTSVNLSIKRSSGNLCIGTVTDVASAKLQVASTTQGFLPPRMTTTQKNAISSPAAGLMIYDTTLNKLCVFTTAWETITSV
jgi:hypothetical protein